MEKSIGDLAKEVALLRESYAAAEQRESFARNEATDTLNKLNEAQKAFDQAAAELRKNAPRRSDWHSRQELKL